MAREAKVYVGTSGWVYKGWAEAFYPPKLRPTEALPFYATRFPAVEINATFYRLPTPEAVAGWRAAAPPGFLFAVKGSRAVTHYKRLLPGAKSLPLFLERIPALGPRLGPVLWQLPGSFHRDVERLDAFLGSLPKAPWLRNAVEFRHESWFCERVFSVLRKHRAALVAVSTLNLPRVLEVTARFTYVRFHGLEGGAAHDYTAGELEPWAEHLAACARRGIRGYAFFNNDLNAHAPANAALLMKKLGPLAAKTPPARGG